MSGIQQIISKSEPVPQYMISPLLTTHPTSLFSNLTNYHDSTSGDSDGFEDLFLQVILVLSRTLKETIDCDVNEARMLASTWLEPMGYIPLFKYIFPLLDSFEFSFSIYLLYITARIYLRSRLCPPSNPMDVWVEIQLMTQRERDCL